MAICLALIISCTHPVRRLVFQPHKIESIPAFPDGEKEFERFWLKTDQAEVESWLFKPIGVDDAVPGPAVLMAHGNRELIDFYRERAKGYQRLGYTVLLCEYRGYGRSTGAHSRERVAADFKAFYDYLVSLRFVDPKKVVFHGRSLGGSALSELARNRQAAGIIVESTFISIQEMAHGAPNFLLVDRYDTLSSLMDYPGPILIIHGTRDDVVPVRHALEMKKRIPRAELILYDFGHSDGPPDWEVYWMDISAFLKKALE